MKIANIKLIEKCSTQCYPIIQVISSQIKRCQFKFVSQKDLDDCVMIYINKQSYDEYMLNYNQILNISENSPQYQEIQEITQFVKLNKDNFYKNLLYAFNRHIKQLKEPQLIKLYESMTINDWKFDHIQYRVNKNLDNCDRLGLKVRNLVKNKNLKRIFIHFLKNAKQMWLDNSKIKNVDQYQEFINLFLKAYNYRVLSYGISYYKKHKKK
ncbi:hypothetical protein ABPG72_016513 [Tetrahymena utriculariae]